MTACSSAKGIVSLEFADPATGAPPASDHAADPGAEPGGDPAGRRWLASLEAQLGEYFSGARRAFDLPLAPEGTDFQKTVWRQLSEIPYGTTLSYAAEAAAIGSPKAVRAVAAANARNPIAIVVPCHRVVGSDGSLTGYAGGLARKRALLDLERGSKGLLEPGSLLRPDF